MGARTLHPPAATLRRESVPDPITTPHRYREVRPGIDGFRRLVSAQRETVISPFAPPLQRLLRNHLRFIVNSHNYTIYDTCRARRSALP